MERLRALRDVPAPALPQPVTETTDVLPVTSPVTENVTSASNPSQAAETAKLFAEFQAQQKAAAERMTAAELREKQVAERLAAAEAKEARLQLAKTNPIDFLAEAGMTEGEWREFLTTQNLTPEQKRVRELEKTNAETRKLLQDMQQQLSARDQAAQQQQQAAVIAQNINKYPAIAATGGANLVLQAQQALSKQQNRAVTWEEAAAHQEKIMMDGFQAALKNKELAVKLGINVSKPTSEPAAPKSPTTLSKNTAPTSAPNGNKPGPRDWAAKKAAYLAAIKQ